jgi:hypothetical protein
MFFFPLKLLVFKEVAVVTMGRYSVETKLSPAEVLKKAESFFGDEGVGLELVETSKCCLLFERDVGHVRVSATEKDGTTQVELTTREWTYDVEKFMREIS